MAGENVELVRRGLEAWNRGDLESLLETADPEVEMTPVIAQLVEGDNVVYRGMDGVRRFWEDWRLTWDFRFGELDLRDVGDRVVMITHVTVTSQTSGMDLGSPMAAVFEFREGRITRMTSYLDPAEALEAAGLPPG